MQQDNGDLYTLDAATRYERNRAAQTSEHIGKMLAELSETLQFHAARFAEIGKHYEQDDGLHSNAAEKLARLIAELSTVQIELVTQTTLAYMRRTRADAYGDAANW